MTSKPETSSTLARRCLAEGVATFFLVWIGVGAIAVDTTSGALGHVGISLSFGFVVCAMVYATGHISGAHLNPAVTVGFLAIRRFPIREVVPYIMAQCAGALVAAVSLRTLVGLPEGAGVTLPSVALMPAIGVEFLLTFALMFVIAAVATDPRASGATAGVAIGLAAAMGALVGGPLTGASMNPARSLGPAVITGVLTAHWLYWVAPVVGAVLGALTYTVVRRT